MRHSRPSAKPKARMLFPPWAEEKSTDEIQQSGGHDFRSATPFSSVHPYSMFPRPIARMPQVWEYASTEQ